MSIPVTHRFGRRRGFDRFDFQVFPECSADERKGQQVTLKVRGFTPDPKPGLLEVANMAHYKGCLGYITFWRDDWSTVEGSAAVIGPGVALTAFHVVSDLLPEIVAGDLNLMLLAPTPDGGRAWRIKNITRVGGTDLAILSLTMGSKMPRRRELSHLTLCALPPDPGELVMISGFRAAEDVVAAEQGVYFPVTGTSIKHGMRLWRAVGTVLPAIIYMTKQANESIAAERDRPAITPAMTEAGVAAFDQWETAATAPELVAEIYSAMHRHREERNA